MDYQDTLTSPYYAPIIARLADALTGLAGPRVSPAAIEHIAAQAVHEARLRGMSDAYSDLLSAGEVADRLGVTLAYVTRLAQRAHDAGQPIGAKLGTANRTTWIFRSGDVAALQSLRQPPGRPMRTSVAPGRQSARALATTLQLSKQTVINRARALGFPTTEGFTPDQVQAIQQYTSTRAGGRPEQLTAHDVHTIRRRLAAGESPSRIAVEFGVRAQTITNIRTGRTWRNLAN